MRAHLFRGRNPGKSRIASINGAEAGYSKFGTVKDSPIFLKIIATA